MKLISSNSLWSSATYGLLALSILNKSFLKPVQAEDSAEVEEALAEIAAEDDYPEGRDGDDPEGRKLKGVLKMAFNMLVLEPTFMPNIPVIQKRKKFKGKMQNYGCSCFPGNEKKAEKSSLYVDELDQLCRNLRICRRCIEVEHEDECDVNFGQYYWKADPVTQKPECLDPLKNAAGGSKNNLCQLNICKCDLHFVQGVYELWMGQSVTGWEWDESYWLDQTYVKKMIQNNRATEIFDPNVACYRNPTSGGNGTGGGGTKDIQCCGEVPYKNLYDADSHSCCMKSAKSYLPVIEDCCADGTIKAIGDCM